MGFLSRLLVHPKRIWFVRKGSVFSGGVDSSISAPSPPSTLGPIGQGLPFAALANATSGSASVIAELLGPNSYFHTTREDEEEAAALNRV